MKDDLSQFTDENFLKSNKVSRVGLLFVFLYLIPCVIAFSYYLECGERYFCIERNYLLLLTFPWSTFIGALFTSAQIAFEPEPSGFFYSDYGIPTWRTIFASYLIIAIGILLNSFFLFLIGEKLQRLFRKTK